jgi:predicted nucleic acid-binding protein
VTAFVLDASIAVGWCFADEATPVADALLDRLAEDEEAVAPSLWPIEVANALAIAERRGRLDVAGLRRSLILLQQLEIAIDTEAADRAFGDLLDLARSERLTVYDAAYLELALRLGVPLASKDAHLRQAATKLGVPLLGV